MDHLRCAGRSSTAPEDTYSLNATTKVILRRFPIRAPHALAHPRRYQRTRSLDAPAPVPRFRRE